MGDHPAAATTSLLRWSGARAPAFLHPLIASRFQGMTVEGPSPTVNFFSLSFVIFLQPRSVLRPCHAAPAEAGQASPSAGDVGKLTPPARPPGRPVGHTAREP